MEMRAPVMVKQGGQEVLRQLPPGFRFRPTDEELVLQYLRRKALALPLPAAVIPDVDNLYSLDPWDIPGASEGEKYFFAVRPSDGKSGGRTATASGYWKPAAGGRERPVVVSRCGRNHLVGVKKSMAFVPRRSRGKGRKTTSPAAPVQTGWVMHEYRLALPHQHKNGCCLGEAGTEEWVVCRIFKNDRSSSSSRQQTLGGHGTDDHRTMPMPQSPSSPASSSSCVTSGSSSDLQEEVSS
ncbi:NAC domain-containing protein 83 [Lolium perenne]|uniref:NAC domain-containing protein 83 n=1 Tax=Lolium perenne TaxID=4522 RepID=UPI0021EB4DEE|nr:NAC domain-containing protein 83-like [Lolium perenne]